MLTTGAIWCLASCSGDQRIQTTISRAVNEANYCLQRIHCAFWPLYRIQTWKAKVCLHVLCVFWRMWMYQVVSAHKALHYYLQCLVANWTIWIIIHVQCVVYSGNEAAPTLCFDLWIMHQEVKLKRLCTFIWTLLLIDRNRPRWSMCACCQALDYINDALSRWKETFINSDKQG